MIFSLDGEKKIISLDQFEQGCSYVCSSSDNYVKLDYQCTYNNLINNGSHSKNKNNFVKKSINDTNNRQLNSPLQTSSLSSSSSSASPTHKTPDFIRPKLVTVIRNGIKPRKAVRILLNKKTAQTYDQVLSEITNSIHLDCGSVKKIYAINGKQVQYFALLYFALLCFALLCFTLLYNTLLCFASIIYTTFEFIAFINLKLLFNVPSD